MSAPRAPKAPAQKACNKGGTSVKHSAPSSNDKERDESSAEDKSTPRPSQRPLQAPSRPQSAVHSHYASIPPAANRNNPASSEDQLSQLVFSPEPIQLHPQYLLEGAASSIPAPQAQWSHAAAPEWTNSALVPPENWASDDVSMSGPQSGAQSSESTTAPSDTHGANESAHKSGAPQAKGLASFSPADIAKAPDVVAQWFNACVSPREDDTSAWESIRSMQTSINRMVSNIRQTDWNHAISMANDEDADQTIRHHIHPPLSSHKGKERAALPPPAPPRSSPMRDDPAMGDLEYGSRTPFPQQREQQPPKRRKTDRIEPCPLLAAPIVPFQQAGPPPRPPRSALRPAPRRIKAREGRKPPPSTNPSYYVCSHSELGAECIAGEGG
ncbi:hypothetical protein H1R20_g993, partial [Candolleomyces eurysporus]